jgi:hypothetical protein
VTQIERALVGLCRLLLWLLVWLLAVAGALIAALAVGLEAWYWYSRPPLIRDLAGTFFTAGVPGSNRDLAKAFNQRVQSAFPIGLPEAKLREALERQGFRRRGYGMHFDTADGPVCGTAWAVFWKTNNSGAVTEISGFAKRICL